jgi:hypothetical protein
MRSTSPPKSAWPGVSTMLMRVPFHSTEVGLAKIVMPRSRSMIIAVHRAFGHGLIFAEGAGLFQQVVDQRGLAVVDMRDDRDIAEVHGGPLKRKSIGVGRAVTGSGRVWLG